MRLTTTIKTIYLAIQNALQYLYSRGITKESIDKFQIGYASSSNDTINYLKTTF